MNGFAVFLPVFFPLFILFLRTLSPTVPLEDGGEMIRAAWCLGVTHPPGYPLYAMVARLSMEIPLGDPAFRVNLLSAVSGAGACGVLALACREILEESAGLRLAVMGGIFSGLLLGTGYSFWWQSVIAEKYAFNALLASLTLLALVRAVRGGSLNPLALAYGAWLGHHGQALYFLPSVILVLYFRLKDSGMRKALAGISGFLAILALGFSPKLAYTPLRAAAHPLHNWNDPETWNRFREYFTADMYAWRIFYQSPAAAVSRLARHAVDFIPHQVGWPGAFLALAGAYFMAVNRRRVGLLLGLSAAAGTVFCIFFRLEGADVETYYMPVFMLAAVFIAAGTAGLAEKVRIRGGRIFVPVSALVLVLASAVLHRPAGRDRHYFAYDSAHNILDSVPSDAILLANGDAGLFPLWYVHDILGMAPGVIPVDAVYMTPEFSPRPLQGRVQLLFPEGSRELARRFPFLDMLVGANTGHPLYLARIFPGLERVVFISQGSAYRVLPDWAALGRADPDGEFAVYRRRARMRGIYSGDAGIDKATQQLLAGYVASIYWRAYALMFRKDFRRAEAMLGEALSWPGFAGVDRAALHGSIAWCREKRGDPAGAISAYSEAIRLEPSRNSLLKPFADLLYRQGRKAEALALYRRIAAMNPGDAQTRARIMEIVVQGGTR